METFWAKEKKRIINELQLFTNDITAYKIIFLAKFTDHFFSFYGKYRNETEKINVTL